jgi:hypothetical protein
VASTLALSTSAETPLYRVPARCLATDLPTRCSARRQQPQPSPARRGQARQATRPERSRRSAASFSTLASSTPTTRRRAGRALSIRRRSLCNASSSSSSLPQWSMKLRSASITIASRFVTRTRSRRSDGSSLNSRASASSAAQVDSARAPPQQHLLVPQANRLLSAIIRRPSPCATPCRAP